jgi:CRISPR-associated protein Csh1
MLSAIKRIGEVLMEGLGIENVIPKDYSGKIISFLFEERNGNWVYAGLLPEDMDNSKAVRTLLTVTSSKGQNPAPIAPITDPVRTSEKVMKWINKVLNNCLRPADNLYNLMGTIKNLLNQETTRKENLEKISSLIKTFKSQKVKQIFLTVKLRFEDDTERFLGDFKELRTCAIELEKQRTQKSSDKGICSLCGEEKLVFARTVHFKFDTDDKPGFIAGIFDKSQNWKNIPVCEDCREKLKIGRRYIEENLNFKFYGLNYWLIPQPVLGDHYTFREILDILSFSGIRDTEITDQQRKMLTNDEKEIFELLSIRQDILTVSLAFMEVERSAERILLLIQDIYPSRIREIFNAKEKAENIVTNETFNFGTFREFFRKTDENKRENNLDQYFLTITEAVFKGKPLDLAFILKYIMLKLRQDFINIDDQEKAPIFYRHARQGLLALTFLNSLGILNTRGRSSMASLDIGPIIEKYSDTLNTPAKRGVFLLGVLCEQLLAKQKEKRGSKPFLKKLKGLKMNQRDIVSLFSEMRHKFEEYDEYNYLIAKLFEIAADYLLKEKENWELSTDEINFYFATGMALSWEIIGKIRQETKKED